LHDWAGANDAHLTPKHIQELGQFIKAGSAQETAQAGDAGVVAQLEVKFLSL
jgi:hypothetical protein